MGNWQIQVASSGSYVDLETSYGFDVLQSVGAGMPPIQNISTAFGLLDGALFQRQRTDVRSFTLLGFLKGTSVSNLHTKRSALIDEIKPDRSASQSPVILRYIGGASTLSASCYYEGGLELGNVNNTTELNIALRFMMYDPYFEKITNSSATLVTQASVANAKYILQRAACGGWEALGTGLSKTTAGAATYVSALAAGSGTALFAAGLFDLASGTAACCIAKWSGTAWTGIGASHNGDIVDLAFDPAGTNLYAVGAFTTFNGSAKAGGVARWNGTAWSPISNSAGGNSDVECLAFGNDGQLYIGGGFTTFDGFTVNRVARHNGASWVAMDGGFPARVHSLARGQDGAIFAGGAFTTAGSAASAIARLARWNGTTWTSVASGVNNGINALALNPNGDLYAGGVFTATGSNVNAANRVAKTNTTNWATLGAGVNSTVDVLYYAASQNQLFAGGNFTTAGSVTTPGGGAVWQGSSWFPLDVTLPGAASILAFDYTNDKLTIGFTASGTASAAGVTAISNGGTATTYPIFTACAPTGGSTRLYQLVNYTTKDAIYFNLTLNAGEVVTLDLRPGQKTLSSNFRGNIIGAIAPGSNVATWKLLPGTNHISIFLSGGSGAGKLSWVERFWGLDG